MNQTYDKFLEIVVLYELVCVCVCVTIPLCGWADLTRNNIHDIRCYCANIELFVVGNIPTRRMRYKAQIRRLSKGLRDIKCTCIMYRRTMHGDDSYEVQHCYLYTAAWYRQHTLYMCVLWKCNEFSINLSSSARIHSSSLPPVNHRRDKSLTWVLHNTHTLFTTYKCFS